jgi:GNAT superfamily N-acetyltransferase
MSGAHDYSFRPVEVGDQAFLFEMLYHAIFISQGQPPLPRSIVNEPDLASYINGWGRNGDAGIVAVLTDTQAPVGAAWFRCFTPDSRGYGFVDLATPELSIAVLPGHRNLGLGTEMMHRLIEIASTRFSSLSLSCDPENPAMNLYRRLGFKQLDGSRTMLLSLTMPTNATIS